MLDDVHFHRGDSGFKLSAMRFDPIREFGLIDGIKEISFHQRGDARVDRVLFPVSFLFGHQFVLEVWFHWASGILTYSFEQAIPVFGTHVAAEMPDPTNRKGTRLASVNRCSIVSRTCVLKSVYTMGVPSTLSVHVGSTLYRMNGMLGSIFRRSP